MPVLPNSRHERFAQELAKGKAASEAYKLSGYRATGNGAEVNASRLLRNPKVKARLAELQTRVAEKVVKRIELSRMDILQMLIDDRNLARELGQSAAAMKADELLGKELHRMFVERREVGRPGDFTSMPDAELGETFESEARAAGYESVAEFMRAVREGKVVVDGNRTEH